MLFDSGVGASRKVLEAYMGKAAWPAEPLGTYLATMLWEVIVLLGQHEHELKSGLPWLQQAHFKERTNFGQLQWLVGDVCTQ